MTVQECYEAMNGNYKEAQGRLMKDELIQKFLFKFLDDKSFDRLCAAMDEKDYEQAFAEAHTLKGVSANMALTQLYQAAGKMTEDLRGGNCSENAQAYLEETKAAYETARTAIEQLQQSAN